MIVQAYIESQCTKFPAAGWTCWSFTPYYLEPCTWPDAISRWIRQWNSIKFCENLGRNEKETLAVIRQAFGKDCMSRTRVFQWHDGFRANRKRRDRWRPKSRACSSFSLTSRGLFTKNSSWQAKQSIPNITARFYGDCVKMCEDFAPKFGDKRTGCCITTTHCFALPFSPGNFLPKATWLSSSTHPTSFYFPDWRWNWKAAILARLR
jgi:hypothetical protein